MYWYLIVFGCLFVGTMLIVLSKIGLNFGYRSVPIADRNKFKNRFIKYLRDNEDEMSTSGICIDVMMLIAFVIMTISLICCHNDFDVIINEYNSTKTLVETYDRGDYGNAPALMEKVININSQIAIHKAKYNNRWTNWFYSDEVGNLEPLTLK